ncbi:MAG TPA: DUF6600 domain-containing protein [Bryobacteraceae bacterium]|nr:DUF6600 domain-containing protein [Bryobacteraceae bacterium]
MKRTWVMWMAAGILLSGCAWAQDEETGRGVARISLLNGDVSVRRGDSGDWVAAAINAPLVVSDHVLTGTGSRAEVQFDYANFLRLSSDAEIRLAELENNRYQIQISRGTITFRVLRDAQADVELDTPNVSVRPVKRGIYRVTVTDDGQSEVTVRSGEAETFTPRGSEHLGGGKTMLVRGTTADPEFQVVREIPDDSWDRWNEDRDHRLERTRSYEYVSRDIYGAEDLDSYGRWIYVAPYGWVWSPSGVAGDWAPYRAGRWAWVDWYGWTWVSYDPWGWAPYHYGRWFHSGPYGWCWYPGPRGYRTAWSPALVAFFGYGGGVGVGVGFGSVGWVPLAPYEPYYPWYGRRYYGYRPGYVDNRVIVNNINITNVYRNARVHNGVTGLDANGFARGGRGGVVEVSAVARQASVMRGPVPVTPVADSVRFSNQAVRVTREANVQRTQFYTRRPAPRVERISFEDQRRGVEQYVHRNYGAPVAGGHAAQQAGGAGAAAPARMEAGRPAAGGNNPANAGNPAMRQETGAGGWRRVPSETGAGNPGNAVRTGGNTAAGTAVHEQPATAATPRGADRTETGNTGAAAPPAQGARDQGAQGAQRTERMAERTERNTGSGNGGWRHFGGNPNTRTQAPAREQAAPRQERNDAAPQRNRTEAAPRQQYTAPSGSSAQAPESPRYAAPRGESVRINSPIVRERSEARSEPRVERSTGGGGAARVERSAPARMESGGGRSGGGNAGGGGGRGRSR